MSVDGDRLGPTEIAVIAVLALVLSVPLTTWLANVIGPIVFTNPDWRRDDSPIILAWIILQALSIGVVILCSILAVKRLRRTN